MLKVKCILDVRVYMMCVDKGGGDAIDSDSGKNPRIILMISTASIKNVKTQLEHQLKNKIRHSNYICVWLDFQEFEKYFSTNAIGNAIGRL